LVGEKNMSMSDPISDFLTRIRNGLLAKKRWVDIPSSALKKRIALVLKEEKFLEDYFFIAGDKNKETIRVFLKYDYQGNPVIDNIKRISRPGLRVYVGAGEAPRVLDGLGISILSTSKGVLSNKKANHLGVGGEILCEVY
jgi:small subunit ribosomal protein S8